ncbi:MAG: glycerophosphoryl diester phosphodiesterase membrane domain-containing protein [Nocardiopsaceae bacterium]|nr:glycerophosphoryl diester phosphodiesterase membrane domain-containing protein [Nocardiopsaceae bacterium]
MTHEDGQAWRAPDTPPEPGGGGAPGPPPVPQTPWAAPGGSPPAPAWSAPGSGVPAAGPASHGAHGPPPPGYGRPWAPRPGVVSLRPLTLGDIFNGAFGYVRDNPKATLGLTAIIMAVVSLLPAVGSTTMLNDITAWSERLEDPGSRAELEFPFSPFTLLAQFGGLVVDFVGSAILTGLLAAVVGLAVLGRKLSMRGAWSAVVPRLGGVFGVAGLYLVYSGAVVLAFGVGVVLIATAAAAGAGAWVTAALTIALLAGWAALSAWVYVRISMAMPITVLERTGPGRSLARSWRLTQGSWWRVFAILLVASFLGSMVASMLSGPFSLIGAFSDLLLENRTVANVVYAAMLFLATVLGGIITAPFVTGITTLLYIDLRMRREGLDLKLQAAAQSGEAIDSDIYLPESSSTGSATGPGYPVPGRPGGQPGTPV